MRWSWLGHDGLTEFRMGALTDLTELTELTDLTDLSDLSDLSDLTDLTVFFCLKHGTVQDHRKGQVQCHLTKSKSVVKQT